MVATRNITDLNALVTPAADDIMLIVDRLSATSTEAKQITWANVQEAIQDIVGSLATDTTSINFTYDDANGQLTAAVTNNTSTQKTIFHDGTTPSTRQEGRFIDGAGINVVVADNSSNDRADITVSNTGVVNASTNTVPGTSLTFISSVTTENDGSKTLSMRPLKVGSNKLSATLTDSNNSLTLDVDPSNININDLNSSSPLGVGVGGTGATTANDARVALGTAKSGANSDITSISGLTTALTIAQGGTGAQTAAAALKNLVGLNSVAHVGPAGISIVHSTQNLVSGSYRAELRGIKPASGNQITVAVDNNDVAIGANANNILDAISGVRSLNNARLTGLSSPLNDGDAATKAYVDSVAQGLDIKEACRVATTGNLATAYNGSGQTLTANSNGAITVDGVSLSVADRVLIKDQTDGTKNGIYTVTTVGDGSNPFVLTRALDFNTNNEIGAGSFMFIEAGTANAGKSFIQSTSGPTLDSTALVFTIFGDNTIAASSVTNAKLANMAVATVKGRAAGSGTGAPVDLSADQLIAIVNTSSSTINTARVAVASMNEATIKGRATGGGNGDPQDLSVAQVVAILNTSTTALDSGTY